MNGIIANDQLQRKYDLTSRELESFRHAMGGRMRTRQFKNVEHRGRLGNRWKERVQLNDWDSYIHNIVTNQGLAHALGVVLHGETQITTWYGALSKSNTTPLSTHTYSSPGYTEATTSDLDEATRPEWVEGSVTGTSTASVDNTSSPMTFTGDGSFTAYGVGLVGGGSSPTTMANTAGGGTLYSSGLFGSGRAMDVDVVLEVDYTFQGEDDGA